VWLQEMLDRRDMTLAGLEKAGGPNRRTAKKILEAVPVTKRVLKRLANALLVNPSDIP